MMRLLVDGYFILTPATVLVAVSTIDWYLAGGK
jgi:hypothetical protein